MSVKDNNTASIEIYNKVASVVPLAREEVAEFDAAKGVPPAGHF